MHFLVINCGSSSVKMTLFELDGNLLKRLVDGQLKNLFSPHSILEINGKKIDGSHSCSSYASAIETLVHLFEKEGLTLSSLKGIGHRVVHGGGKYVQSTEITPAVEKEINALSELAPLHNPPSLKGIECTKQLFPQVPQVAVFDTAFHSHLLPQAAYYPIPWGLSQKHQIKRYGFHGIAHAFSWKRYAEFCEKSGQRAIGLISSKFPLSEAKPDRSIAVLNEESMAKNRAITVHLGNGCSMAAIREGVSLDTTMGFTPLDGLMMGTRSGELDPAIVAFLCDKEKKSPDEIIDLLNHQSGLLGIFGKSGDMQEIVNQAQADPQAKLALEMFIFRVQKKLGAYLTVLQGVDAIIFSGGIGENSQEVRKRILEGLSWYGVSIDEQKNVSCHELNPGEMQRISKQDSKVDVCVVGSDENGFIAEELFKLLKF